MRVSGHLKSRPVKAAGAESCGQRRSQKFTPLWRKARFEVKMYKTRQVRSTFWSSDVEKLHAAVAKSAFWSEHLQNRSGSEHFLEFWCRKIARGCGQKRMSKSKFSKTDGLGALFEVSMSKNCTRLWPEAHFQVKMLKKTDALGALFEVWCRKIARGCGEKRISKSKCSKKTDALGALFEVWCRKIGRRCGEKHVCEWKCTKHVRSGQFFEVLMSKNCMNLWREAHLSVKMYKIPVFWRAFSSSDVEQLVCGKLVSQSISQLVN